VFKREQTVRPGCRNDLGRSLREGIPSSFSVAAAKSRQPLSPATMALDQQVNTKDRTVPVGRQAHDPVKGGEGYGDDEQDYEDWAEASCPRCRKSGSACPVLSPIDPPTRTTISDKPDQVEDGETGQEERDVQSSRNFRLAGSDRIAITFAVGPLVEMTQPE
jgi:hypothetical protein